jgi:hypothetical protein
MEMHTETAANPARKQRLWTAQHVDGRTRGAKRARAIAAELEHNFGGEVTKVQRHAIERAAMWCAIAEDLAARRLAGQLIPLDDVLRAEGVAKRALRSLGIRIESAAPKTSRALAARRERWAQTQAAEAKKAATEATAKATMEAPDGRTTVD